MPVPLISHHLIFKSIFYVLNIIRTTGRLLHAFLEYRFLRSILRCHFYAQGAAINNIYQLGILNVCPQQ